VLKVLGLIPRQVRRVVTFQSMTWAAIALLVGLPVGLALGAAGWREVVRSLGLTAPATLPIGALVAVIVATPTALVLLTWWPARRAARTPAAVTLRSE
jgi:ABC-type lipoprotein release transport system permease subunit